MAQPGRDERFKKIVEHTIEALKEKHGLTVPSSAVEDVVDGLYESTAKRLGLTADVALRSLEPDQIADLIARANEDERQTGVRRLREDLGTARLTVSAAGQLLKAIGQAAKYSVRNHDEPTADHAADLVSELGAGLLGAVGAGEITVARGVLSEAAQVLDHTAERFTDGTWSTCPCGKQHGQVELDSLMPEALRADAEMARQLLMRAISFGPSDSTG